MNREPREPRRIFTPSRLAIAVVAAAAIGAAVHFGAPVEASAPPPVPQAVPVSVAAAVERRITEYDEFSGRLEAIDKVEVRPRVAGYIESIHFTPSAMVRRGDTLFVIDPKPFEAEVARAEAAVAAARRTRARAGGARRHGAVAAVAAAAAARLPPAGDSGRAALATARTAARYRRR
jgi:multidrug efflux pump subunit AcrA (membrane-fusion protein)